MQHNQDWQSSDMDSESSRRGSGCALWGFAIGFLAVGLACSAALIVPTLGILRAQGWVNAPCQIVSSQLERGAETGRVAITFVYEFQGQHYQSDQYCFLRLSTNTAMEWKQKVIDENPPGKKTTCYVNPADPTEAVIERDWVPDMWWCLLPLVILIVGIGLLRAALGFGGTRSETRDRFEIDDGDVDDDLAENESDTGPVVLTPTVTPLQALLGGILIALFWNGVLSIFLWEQIAHFRRGGFWALELFPALFLTPFVLVGIGLILFVGYSLLALFNPRPTLIVNSAVIPLGGALVVQWTLSGRPIAMRHFRISLKGVERATYVRGTSTSTDTSPFADYEIAATEDLREMEEGTARYTVPSDTMHSFESANNAIAWSLEVHGEIPWWPDLAASFPVTIEPAEARATHDHRH